jgi:hypothetical protein
MSVDISLDTTEYDVKIVNGLSKIPTFSEFLVDETAKIIEQEMRATVPVKTGTLRDSIGTENFGQSARVSTNSGYGLFVDLPTKPHIIRARNALYLRIPLPDGKIIFRKQVFHTGTKGAFFRRKTLNRSAPKIQQAVQERLDQLFEGIDV